jgi:hypothetical protein
MRKIYLLWILTISILSSQDFNQGPYGTTPFEIAGDFTLDDLNKPPLGDINIDSMLNIQDVMMLIGVILETINLDYDIEEVADINQDGLINVQDITMLLQVILYPEDFDLQNGWNFSEEWNAMDTYIFITLGPASSTALWNANDLNALLENSPNNVHYFFLSNRTNFIEDIISKKNSIDLMLSNMSEEMQIHWKKYLHFVSNKCDSYESDFVDAVCGIRSVGIDRFQRWKQIGYLGNPANFNGTYIAYLAHEAIYYNYEHEVLYEDPTTYDEITVFDQAYYTGGWAATISQPVTFPSNEELNNYSGMSIELLRGCPDVNGNYSDQGCDDYDRIAKMLLCDADESNCHEMARWITPFDRQPHHLTDITPFISMLRPGGDKVVKFQESGWPNSLLTMKFRFYHSNETNITPHIYEPIWTGTIGFNPDYDQNRPPVVFNIPDDAVKVEFVSYITGHGWGCDGYNCAEFCNSKHKFSINGGTYEFETGYPEAADNNYCMELETIGQGVVPNQYGTWGYGRAGWCPGQDVHPFITDITDYVSMGDENVIEYSACRDTWNGCVAPPICPDNDCYCPEIAMSSYIIVWR